MGYSRYALDELSRRELAFIPLIVLVGKRKIHKLKAGHKILGVDEKKFDLILNARYDSFEVDELIKMTSNIISHYFFQNQKKKLRDERAKRK